MKFYLGTHIPGWLQTVPVPLFVSQRRLRTVKKLPRAQSGWALDSGGFSELSMFGTWTISPETYVCDVRRYMTDVGKMDWAAIQDWMCEPWVLAKTGGTIIQHQQRTVASYLLLRQMAPEIPWAPVIQGFSLLDYLRCLFMYVAMGVDLHTAPVVGVGSVCRRQHTPEIQSIFNVLSRYRLRLHGFGVKSQGLQRCLPYLASADSMAWSFTARRLQRPFFLDCTTHKNCANCARFALHWRNDLLERVA